MITLPCSAAPKLKNVGLTLIELIISIAIMSILAAITIPNFNAFLVQLRVDNEISQLHRMLLNARNGAINYQMPVTVCPLDLQNRCSSQWGNEIAVFIDLNSNNIYEPNNNDVLLRTKSAITTSDKLQYGLRRNRIIYAPTGRTSGWGSNGTFKYCPKDYPDKSRAISVATSGRVYTSTDIDNDNIDELRSGIEILCRDE